MVGFFIYGLLFIVIIGAFFALVKAATLSALREFEEEKRRK